MSICPDRPIFASVIVPVYKTASTMRETIDGILSQNANVEVIVVNDGSPDNCAEIAKSYGDRIRYIEQPNAGVPNARNNAVEVARGEFLHFLDSDDIVLPGFYEAFEESYRQNPSVDLFYSNWIFGDEDCTPISHIDSGPVSGNMALDLFRRNRFAMLAVICRRSTFLAAGRFDEAFPASAEWEFWIRMARSGARIRHIPSYLCVYRNRKGSISKGFFRMWRAVKMVQARHSDLVAGSPERSAILRGQVELLLDRDLRYLYGDDMKKPWIQRRLNRTKKLCQVAVSAPGLLPHMARRSFTGIRRKIGGTFLAGATLAGLLDFFSL